MDIATIRRHLRTSVKKLLRNQPNLFRFTSQTNQTEWNIAHHFATELHRSFPDLDCDLDVCKPNLGRHRPDVIVHTRGTHDDNLLVVEVKRSRDDVSREIAKIRRYWFVAPLRYQFGAVVVLDESEPLTIAVIQNV